ncbi:glycine--tRNA ligase subunit beta [Melghirimyces algeriensis]|uniref:Glycine--tRNA ligase beta subunit n=1 Tax=Melghirimyces algeriensis TaxID=910412 RepID=A0A521BSS4_9BACL|nr:glycine--tRNA ligase subunit beta [Melghirimyces algeriensis]SMO50169.1 glycyl-tRNA synthetase beta chain [Melghirimyces algeriensis]
MAERDLLLEIGCEEMPARFVEGGMKQLEEKLNHWFDGHRITYGSIRTYATPRRLAVIIEKVADRQADVEEEVRGPAKRIAVDEEGNWTKAALGFARKQGVSAEELQLDEHKGETYVFARKFQRGLPTVDLLKEELSEVLGNIHFPKTMRWGDRRTRFIRPVRWLVCLFGQESVSVQWAGVTASNRTRGHRFLGEEITLDTPSDYVDALRNEWVLVDVKERRDEIRNQLKRMEEEHGWNIPIDEGLLNEVTHLVEYPTALFGRFEESFLELPAAVLITTMREHQRYFPVEDQNGHLLPYFVTVRNGDHRSLDIVAKGNEKVLSARLADARFFYEEDQKLSIEKAVSKLDQVVYFEDLGTIGDQVRRIRHLVKELAEWLDLKKEERTNLFRAAEICKFDLSTLMVDEFPELSGVMGEEYAIKAGENPEVARGIMEHHYPRFSSDQLPEGMIGSLISLADKMDAVVSAFAIGIQPTGSQDPYGLRRRASGVVQIMVGQGWNEITLTEIIDLCLNRLEMDGWLKREKEEVKKELISFFTLRMKALLQEENIRYDLIDAVLESDISRPRMVLDKAKVLTEEVEKESFKTIVEGFSRAANLAAKGDPDAKIDGDLLEKWSERKLFAAIKTASERFESARNNQDAREMFEAISKLATVIHDFFDEVLVMADDEVTRQNRLALLREIDRLTSGFAAFNKIVFAS